MIVAAVPITRHRAHVRRRDRSRTSCASRSVLLAVAIGSAPSASSSPPCIKRTQAATVLTYITVLSLTLGHGDGLRLLGRSSPTRQMAASDQPTERAPEQLLLRQPDDRHARRRVDGRGGRADRVHARAVRAVRGGPRATGRRRWRRVCDESGAAARRIPVGNRSVGVARDTRAPATGGRASRSASSLVGGRPDPRRRCAWSCRPACAAPCADASAARPPGPERRSHPRARRPSRSSQEPTTMTDRLVAAAVASSASGPTRCAACAACAGASGGAARSARRCSSAPARVLARGHRPARWPAPSRSRRRRGSRRRRRRWRWSPGLRRRGAPPPIARRGGPPRGRGARAAPAPRAPRSSSPAARGRRSARGPTAGRRAGAA